MKYNIKRIIPVTLIILIFSLNGCYDEKMEWVENPYGDPITKDEIPLTLLEQIAALDVLKAYATTFPIGMGADMTLYTENETYRNTVNENFQNITVGYHMKHGAMVGSDGNLRFTGVDNFVNNYLPANMELYGHTLVWHQNQNGDYLRSLIAPTIIPPSGGQNLLDLSGLKDGSFSGWGKQNNADGISIEGGAGLSSSDSAIKFVTTSSSANEWDTQLESPDVYVTEGHAIMLKFWVRSVGDEDGSIRVSFKNMSNGYPWYEGGALVSTSSEWKLISYGADGSLTATGSPIRFDFDFGKKPNITYYVDIATIEVIDLDAPAEVNYVANGDFETGDLSNWADNNPGAGISVVDSEKNSGTYSVQMISGSGSANAWDLQLESDEIHVENGKAYTFSFFIKSDKAGQGRVSFPGNDNAYPWMNWQGTGAGEFFSTSTGWQYISVDFTPGATPIKLSFDLGYLPDVTYWLDDIKLVEKEASKSPGLRAGPTIIEKTPEEKEAIIREAMTKWINEMVGHYKDRVNAWDVVNEPMGDAGGIRHGNYQGDEDDIFHWQDFLGDNFAAEAFKLARAAGKDGDKLFINDYNLEYNLDKCRNLIAYVARIENLGAKVDGIGTQMHVSIDQNMDNVAEMFRLLAASGKLIKITELDIKVNTASPDTKALMKQAAVYFQIVKLYKEIIPASQQYGITIWSVTDADSWIENDAPCLWTGEYARKAAYKGVADGLAGKEMSEFFEVE